MATRRSRINVRPNLGPKLNRSSAAAVRKTTVVTEAESETNNASQTNGDQRNETDRGTEIIAATDTGKQTTLQEKSSDSFAKKTVLHVSPSETVEAHHLRALPASGSTDAQMSALRKTTPQAVIPPPFYSSLVTHSTLSPTDELAGSAKASTHNTTTFTHPESVKTEARPLVRPRHKFRPNIVEAVRARKRHLSASCSEYESEVEEHFQKQPPAVQRTALSAPKLPSRESVVTPIGNTSASESSGVNSSIHQNVRPLQAARERKTSIMEIESEKEKLQRKRHRQKWLNKDLPDKSKMTMMDLIYYNPRNNCQKDQGGRSRTNSVRSEEVVTPVSTPTREEKRPGTPAPDEEDNILVPQVKVGPDGNIILNEESLIIDVSPKKLPESATEVVYEDAKNTYTTYGSYSKRTCSKVWTAKETAKFYKALSTVGTDFSMMGSLFPHRKRVELKNKFKKEERVNKALVDKAIRERKMFDLSTFESSESEVETEKKSLRQTRKTTKKETKQIEAKTTRKNIATKTRKRKHPSGESTSGHSDLDVDAVEADAFERKPGKCVANEEGSIDEDEILDNMCKQTTRAGRQPKRVSVYNPIFVKNKRGRRRGVQVLGSNRLIKQQSNKDISLPKPAFTTNTRPTVLVHANSFKRRQAPSNQVSRAHLGVVQAPSNQASALQYIGVAQTPHSQASQSHMDVMQAPSNQLQTGVKQVSSNQASRLHTNVNILQRKPRVLKKKQSPVASDPQSPVTSPLGSPGNLVFVRGQSADPKSQVIHVYMVSPPPVQQKSTISTEKLPNVATSPRLQTASSPDVQQITTPLHGTSPAKLPALGSTLLETAQLQNHQHSLQTFLRKDSRVPGTPNLQLLSNSDITFGEYFSTNVVNQQEIMGRSAAVDQQISAQSILDGSELQVVSEEVIASEVSVN